MTSPPHPTRVEPNADPEAGSGIAATSWAFESVFPAFKYVLALTAFLFRLQHHDLVELLRRAVLGAPVRRARSLLTYKFVFLAFTWAGAVFAAQAVLDFGGLMILGMAFPNLVGVFLISGKVKTMLDDHFARLRAGAFEADAGRDAALDLARAAPSNVER